MATLNQIKQAKITVGSLIEILNDLWEIADLAEQAKLRGHGVIPDVTLTHAQKTALRAQYDAKKTELTALWGTMP